jgi:hypothetical protein
MCADPNLKFATCFVNAGDCFEEANQLIREGKARRVKVLEKVSGDEIGHERVWRRIERWDWGPTGMWEVRRPQLERVRKEGGNRVRVKRVLCSQVSPNIELDSFINITFVIIQFQVMSSAGTTCYLRRSAVLREYQPSGSRPCPILILEYQCPPRQNTLFQTGPKC